MYLNCIGDKAALVQLMACDSIQYKDVILSV